MAKNNDDINNNNNKNRHTWTTCLCIELICRPKSTGVEKSVICSVTLSSVYTLNWSLFSQFANNSIKNQHLEQMPNNTPFIQHSWTSEIDSRERFGFQQFFNHFVEKCVYYICKLYHLLVFDAIFRDMSVYPYFQLLHILFTISIDLILTSSE